MSRLVTNGKVSRCWLFDQSCRFIEPHGAFLSAFRSSGLHGTKSLLSRTCQYLTNDCQPPPAVRDTIGKVRENVLVCSGLCWMIIVFSDL